MTEYDRYEAGELEETEAVARMFRRLARQGIDPIDHIEHDFGWDSGMLDDLAQERGFEDSAEWLNVLTGGC
jgi:hypothetical protein